MSASTSQPVPFLDFSRQYTPIREEILAAVTHVLDSQRFILGPEVTALEAACADACATPHAIACASGTDALWLAFAAAQIPDDSPIITTPFSFFASASSILRANCRPLFADIDPLTFNLSPECTAEVFLKHPETKAILPVHLFGQCADWDAFTRLQQSHPGLLLIEDAAQAFGATWDNIPAGALGDAAAFSFYPTKNLAAFGDAGLLTTRSSAIAQKAISFRAHGMTRRYYHDDLGWNSRMDTLQAAILLVRLPHLAAANARRRSLAARYNQLFLRAGLGAVPSPENPGSIQSGLVLPYTALRAQHVFHQYVIRAPRRDDLRARLAAQNIGTEIYYPLPLHLQAALQSLGYKAGDFPQAERAADEVLALPMYPELREDEQDTIVEAIRTFYA